MFTIDEKSTLITALLTRRNVIETGNPYISANDIFKKKEKGKEVTKIGIEGIYIHADIRALSKTEVEEIIKINRLINKVQVLQL